MEKDSGIILIQGSGHRGGEGGMRWRRECNTEEEWKRDKVRGVRAGRRMRRKVGGGKWGG